jgi:hypothetical protein
MAPNQFLSRGKVGGNALNLGKRGDLQSPSRLSPCGTLPLHKPLRSPRLYGAKLHFMFANLRFLWHEWGMGRNVS